MIEVALRQIPRLEERVNQLESELAARAEITNETIRTSALEVAVATEKIKNNKK